MSLDEAAGAASPSAGDGADASIVVEPYSLDETRKKIAYFLLWILVGVILVVVLVALVYSVRCWISPATCTAASSALDILTGSVSPIFTAMVGLVGSVVGFYFGSKQS